jgi:ATPase subunit of ABC transporter with duplicated ATPase domains
LCFFDYLRRPCGERMTMTCLAAICCNLLLQDEPIKHLDIPSCLRLEQALSVYKGTVIAAAQDQ